ncbi:4'-phosphopantetheinyl transferase superfamily protein [Streptomyces sp. MBT27]|uniref:4'-phosphopantetheinyl transferase family protein n=1 Tax=Streptomyces sp. MBT27 TaxID=1488356 RepID=UPI0031FE6382
MPVIELLLSEPTAFAESFEDEPSSGLFPAEDELVAGSVPRRRREFTTVRACARRALGQLGVASVPILPGLRGAPGWPAGVVGSMTHCVGYRAAAVARTEDVVAIGIDAEPNLPIRTDGARDLVTVAEERARLPALRARRPEVHWDRLVFSAKESVYKAWFPLTGRSLDFDQAVVTVDPDEGTFQARLLVPGPLFDGGRLSGFEGRWLLRHDVLLTTIALARRASAAGALV